MENKTWPHRIEGKDLLQGVAPNFLAALRKTESARHLRILFTGETGVGKTPFARHSNRYLSRQTGADRPFEQVNCACLTPEYFQDTLFGHKKGAFTGALSDKIGLVELAAGGDLFLDEIGDMPLSTQVHLLTFLDNMEFYRLGDDKKRTANVRILSATNRDLAEMVEAGKFRRDLYSRLSQVEVSIPPLRERGADILRLADYFLQQLGEQQQEYKRLSPEVGSALVLHDWARGNVRELRDCVERLFWWSQGTPTIELETLLLALPAPASGQSEAAPTERSANGATHEQVYFLGLEPYLQQMEKRVLKEILDQYSGHRQDLAKRLKTSRSTLYRKLKVHGLPPRQASSN